jgi:hypothetical protein
VLFPFIDSAMQIVAGVAVLFILLCLLPPARTRRAAAESVRDAARLQAAPGIDQSVH